MIGFYKSVKKRDGIELEISMLDMIIVWRTCKLRITRKKTVFHLLMTFLFYCWSMHHFKSCLLESRPDVHAKRYLWIRVVYLISAL